MGVESCSALNVIALWPRKKMHMTYSDHVLWRKCYVIYIEFTLFTLAKNGPCNLHNFIPRLSFTRNPTTTPSPPNTWPPPRRSAEWSVGDILYVQHVLVKEVRSFFFVGCSMSMLLNLFLVQKTWCWLVAALEDI